VRNFCFFEKAAKTSLNQKRHDADRAFFVAKLLVFDKRRA
jgi:hypothetical protein